MLLLKVSSINPTFIVYSGYGKIPRARTLATVVICVRLREDARGSGSSDDGGMPSYEDVCNSERGFDSTLNAPGEIEQVSWMPCPSLDDQKRKGCFVMCAQRNNCFCRI